ncbi:hypothetical protein [Streptomyces sp. NBC_01506]|uniref:hypothetical protein n=1 Tax=Streptomyces sp. NBC_01506 TaxID=2903887 RepID=UPI003863FFCA
MAITAGLPLVLLWLILGLLPVRNPSARRLWIGIYIGMSLVALLIAYLYSEQRTSSIWDESADDEYAPLLYVAVLVVPGMLAAMIRLVVSRPDPPTPPPPVVQYLPPPYPYPPQQYPPAQQYPPQQHPQQQYPAPPYPDPQANQPPPPAGPPPATPPPPPSSPPTI